MLTCFKCRHLLYYSSGASMVQCPTCKTINGTPKPFSFTCHLCGCFQQIPSPAQYAVCGQCHNTIRLS